MEKLYNIGDEVIFFVDLDTIEGITEYIIDLGTITKFTQNGYIINSKEILEDDILGLFKDDLFVHIK